MQFNVYYLIVLQLLLQQKVNKICLMGQTFPFMADTKMHVHGVSAHNINAANFEVLFKFALRYDVALF